MRDDSTRDGADDSIDGQEDGGSGFDDLGVSDSPDEGERRAPGQNPPAVSAGPVQLIGGEMLLWSDLDPDTGIAATSPILLPALDLLTTGHGRALVLGMHRLELIERLAGDHSEVHVVVRGWRDAEALAHETGYMTNVRIVCGDAARLPQDSRYDLVVALAGVEAILTPDGLNLDALAVLDRLTDFLAVDGRLLVALENPFGLDRVISARTRVDRDSSSDWPRPGRGFGSPSLRDVETRFSDAGLRVSGRLCLFPGVEDPVVAMVPSALDDLGSSAELAALLGSAVEQSLSERPTIMDPFATVEAAVLSGLGDPLSPGWLLVVDRGDSPAPAFGERIGLMVDAGVDPSWAVVASIETDGEHVFRVTDESRLIAQRRVHRELSLLNQGVIPGQSLQRHWLRVIGAGDLHDLRSSVRTYWNWLVAQAEAGGDEHERVVFAFPSNLIVRDELQLADSSWRMSIPPAPEVLFALHVRRFVATLLRSGYPHPWPASATVDQLTVTFAAFAGVDLAGRLLEATHLEAELRATLSNLTPEQEMHLATSLLSVYSEPGSLSGPYSMGHRESMIAVSRLGRETQELHARVDWLEGRVAARELQLRREERLVARLRRSASFRVGRVITWPARALAGVISRLGGGRGQGGGSGRRKRARSR